MNVLDWLGIPFKMWGRSPDGYDCVGLCLEFIRQEAGLRVPDAMRTDDGDISAEGYASLLQLDASGEFAPFDLIVVRSPPIARQGLAGLRSRHLGVITPAPVGLLTTTILTGSVCVPLSVFTRGEPILEAWRCRPR